MSQPLFDRLLPSDATAAGYLLRLSRPRFWLYLAGPVVVGVAYAAETPAELFSPLAVALFAYFLLPANVFLYGVNDIFDADIDIENPKKEQREVRYRGDWTVPALVVATGALGVAFLPALPLAGVAAMVGFLFLAVEYSAPPLRFKTTPWLDSLSNGLYILPGVVAYAGIAGDGPPLAAIAAGWLWAMGMHTFSAIPDIDPDRAAGIETTATVLGARRTYAYCGGCWLAAAAVFGTVDVFFAAVLGIYPVFVAAIAGLGIDPERAYWWFPALNTAAGTALTLGALWVMLHA
ncbi:lycopene elongase / lycopene 1,2-hydratase [Natronomonas pharaonis DSM 2160]|uniref:Lycopene elongase / lycopene 1,2-hydratase n=1 Tax=Natronomonas pharaonis (strain ATCC 35678 / DSM 2160 / CIP 103997 / JCM 8858 / NBRC 14720 / NCIMB 2260 / Gabara) TaxID=348780 RepID=A0A1U7EYX3_NATPD|nr:prenyltransferase [Natronomonas pharaonis]CAI50474.1 lycopene elongase / lycopene 1,2-hydratase [Natronomonas pharaonis DSM 2160]